MGLLDSLKLCSNDHVNLNAPQATLRYRNIILQKPFLKKIYLDFYRRIQKYLKDLSPCAKVVELGSGGGFLKEIYPNLITSDIIELPHVDMTFSGLEMPFKMESLDALVMVDVLHHIPNARLFFQEARRCLRPGGRMVMIEPANTFWSRFIYQNFHHEAFDPCGTWEFSSSGPLSSANGAIPWILFFRDRFQFEKEFPELKIKVLQNHTSLRYLLSGGLSYRQLLPSCFYPLVVLLELGLCPLNNLCGMFLTIVLEKQKSSPAA